MLLLCGPSGGGKSTLLRLLQGIVPQRSGGDLTGTAMALGHDVTRTAPHDLATAGVTLLFQNPLDGFVADRVADEVAFGPESLGLGRAEIAARVREALDDVGLRDADRRPLGTLSGGEQQRVAVAAALALEPRLLLLDEPTAHLDEPAAIALLAMLDRVRRARGTTIVLAEHRVAVAAPLADRIAVLVGGRMRAAGPPRAILADPELIAEGVPVPRATQVAVRLSLGGELPLTPAELAARVSGPTRSTIRFAPNGTNGTNGPAAAPNDAPIVLRLEHVGHRYRSGADDALVDVNLALRRGERVALIGPSGAGKSTLGRIAVGLRRPTVGHVSIFGITDPSLATIGPRVGLVVQNPLRQLLAATVEREITMGLPDLDLLDQLDQLDPPNPADARARLDDALDRFGLTALRSRHPLSLSEGQRRRVTLAATFARHPELLVLDEPTLAQDETQRAALTALVRELAAQGTAILAITHDREFANDACERIVTLRAGRVIADLAISGDPATAAALAGAGVPLADVPATVMALAARGRSVTARTVTDLVAALR